MRRSAAALTRVALQPVFNISDRVPVGYEVLPRPLSAGRWRRSTATIAQVAVHVAPATVFVPLPALSGAAGVHPRSAAAHITLLLRTRPRPTSRVLRAFECERALGRAIAIDITSMPQRDFELLLQLRPDYVFLSADFVRSIAGDATHSAALSGLVSTATRLDMRIVARGVDDAAIATTLTEHGVQLGMGAHLSEPLVLDPHVAVTGDKVIQPSWFQRHQPRTYETPAPVAAATRLRDLPDGDVRGSESSTFATALAELARTLQAEHDTDRVLELASEAIPRILPVSALAIFEADWEQDVLRPRVLAGPDVVSLCDRPLAMSQGITGWAFRHGRPFNCGNTAQHPAAGTVPGTEEDASEESLVVIPLVAADHRIGVLDVWRRGRDAFSDTDLEQCSLLGHLTAAAWHSAQLYRHLEERSRTDSLTGLHNIRWWHELVAQEEARIQRSGEEAGVLMLDLDHFKLVNDTRGHAVGDQALRAVAAVLRATVRRGDEVVRYGGEEFLVLLHGSGAEGAAAAAEAIRRAIATMPAVAPGLEITASIGVAMYPQHGATLDDAVRAADMAMYAAKRHGRNRVMNAEAWEDTAQAHSRDRWRRDVAPLMTATVPSAG